MEKAGWAWLITGNPGVGKTTVLLKATNMLKIHGYAVGGIITREIRTNFERTGFELIDVSTERKGILASTHLKTGPQVGRYRVGLRDLAEIGAEALFNAVERSNVIVCDEIGPMELHSRDFRRAVTKILGCGKPVIGVIHKRLRDPIVQSIKSCGFVKIVEVTHSNRDYLPQFLADKVLDKLRGVGQ